MHVEVHEECKDFVSTAEKLWVLVKCFCSECRELCLNEHSCHMRNVLRTYRAYSLSPKFSLGSFPRMVPKEVLSKFQHVLCS